MRKLVPRQKPDRGGTTRALTSTHGSGGLNHAAAGPAALAVPSGARRDVPAISAAIVAPIIAGVLFIVVSFRGRGPTWSVVHILRHAGITLSLVAVTRRYRAR